MLIFFKLVLTAAFAFANPITMTTRLASGKNLHTQISPPESGKPTFLFMPGLIRAPLIDETEAKILIDQGFGVVTFNFSIQPFSIATLPAGESPAFYKEEPTLSSLAGETESLTSSLVGQYGITSILPVSLSYSGAVSSHLKGFSFVVDVVPLTSLAAYSPELASYHAWLKSGEIFNPVFGPRITRTSLDQSYRSQWVSQVYEMLSNYNLPKERSQDMIEGYVRVSRTTEGFEWSDSNDATERVFIFGLKESSSLLRHQMQVAKNRLAAGRKESVFLVQEAGHTLFSDFPQIYAEILSRAAQRKIAPGVTIITPSTGQWRTLNMSESIALLERGP